jgi:carbon dioxide concentrating mechanism protein CcmN
MIYLPPSQPVLNPDIRISGDVDIHPTASLAPGVILQAAPNSRIVIGADVCIGMGVIINACQGSIEIESGATLGSGVLIVGESKIGSNVCVGTATTIFKASLPAMAVIKPGSIIGDISRQLEINENQGNLRADAEEKLNNTKNPQTNHASADKDQSVTQPDRTATASSKTTPSTSATPEVNQHNSHTVQKPKTPVVGQVYINQLLVTLFPHNQPINPNSKTNKINN